MSKFMINESIDAAVKSRRKRAQFFSVMGAAAAFGIVGGIAFTLDGIEKTLRSKPEIAKTDVFTFYQPTTSHNDTAKQTVISTTQVASLTP